MRVSAEYAKTHLDDLLAATDYGEVVEIQRDNKPAVRMSLATASPLKQPTLLGAVKGQIWIADDFKSKAASEEMADLFEGKIG